MHTERLGIRWTIGDVSARGFDALRLSVWGAWRVFGSDAHYVICANSVSSAEARRRTGDLPPQIEWRVSTRDDLPAFLLPHLDSGLSEGTGWKFSPLRLFPDRYELALDNDCILWDAPAAIRTWLDGAHASHAVFAADVKQCCGVFTDLCGPEPRNSGIRGLPPHFDYLHALQHMLTQRPVMLRSEQDEQGLQAATLAQSLPLLVVTTDEVTICSPFPPHIRHFGRCGAHFVGLNARSLSWGFGGRNATEYIAEHWDHSRTAVESRIAAIHTAKTVRAAEQVTPR